MFGHFVFREIPEKTETPQKISFQMDSDSMPKMGNAFQGLSLAVEVQLTHTKKFVFILAIVVILNIQISFNSTNEFPEF